MTRDELNQELRMHSATWQSVVIVYGLLTHGIHKLMTIAQPICGLPNFSNQTGRKEQCPKGFREQSYQEIRVPMQYAAMQSLFDSLCQCLGQTPPVPRDTEGTGGPLAAGP